MTATVTSSPAPATERRPRSRPRNQADVASLVDHLSELRSRVLWCVGALIVATVVAWWQRDALFALLDRPLDDRWPIQTFGVTEPFFTSLTVCAQAAFCAVLPLVTWHTWRFVRPALPAHARRSIALLLIAAPALFVSGVMFGYLLVLRPAVHVLLGIAPGSINVVVRASDYYSFVATTLLAIGAAFCFPLALIGAAKVGAVDAGRLRRSRRYAYVLLIVFAAILPTVDPVSLVLETLPLLALYELSILAVAWSERRA